MGPPEELRDRSHVKGVSTMHMPFRDNTTKDIWYISIDLSSRGPGMKLVYDESLVMLKSPWNTHRTFVERTTVDVQ